jgi:hypothetical protein
MTARAEELEAANEPREPSDPAHSSCDSQSRSDPRLEDAVTTSFPELSIVALGVAFAAALSAVAHPIQRNGTTATNHPPKVGPPNSRNQPNLRPLLPRVALA